jgi:hypothetical protein
MAYYELSKYQNTATPNFSSFSNRDINVKFNQVEFNKVFEQRDQSANKYFNYFDFNRIYRDDKIKYNIKILLIILSIIMIGLFILFLNNFIIISL